jgi:hypothetical protein
MNFHRLRGVLSEFSPFFSQVLQVSYRIMVRLAMIPELPNTKDAFLQSFYCGFCNEILIDICSFCLNHENQRPVLSIRPIRSTAAECDFAINLFRITLDARVENAIWI